MAVCILALLGCGQNDRPINARSTERAEPAPALIQKPGRYLIRGGEDVLSIFEAPANALAYQVGETTDDYSNGGLISDRMQPWFFHSAADGSVWVYDVALGVVRWTHHAGEGWQSVVLDEESLDEATIERVQAMPDAFFSPLPAELKDRWGSIREG